VQIAGVATMILRPYQTNILNKLRRDWKQYRTHLIQAPTGAGKTIIAGTITKGFYDKGLRLLFTVPRTALINQTIKSFKSMGIDKIGVMQADHEMTDIDMPIQVGTIQTLARRGYGEFDCVIVDEAHLRNIKLLEFIRDTDIKVIGLTATPYTNWLGNIYENFIKQVTMKQLMDDEFLTQYEFYAPTKPDLTGVKTTHSMQYGSDYAENEIAAIMGDAKIAGDIIETWLKLGEGRPSIAFCCNVLHANFLTLEFRKVGINAEVMVGSTPKEERQRIFKGFEDGIIQIICSVDVLVEGFDSDVRCVIYAKPTKSEMRWVQSIGRAMRTAKGKVNAIILDHSGTVIRLGQPHEIEYNELFSDKDAFKIAQEQRKKEKPEKTDKECSSCHYIKPAGQYVCEKCGFKPIFGQDGEVDETINLESINKINQDREAKRKFYNELCGIWQEKINAGKTTKKGWIAYTYKARFGSWPNEFKFRPEEPSAETLNYVKHINIKNHKIKAKKQEMAKEGIAKLREMLAKK